MAKLNVWKTLAGLTAVGAAVGAAVVYLKKKNEDSSLDEDFDDLLEDESGNGAQPERSYTTIPNEAAKSEEATDEKEDAAEESADTASEDGEADGQADAAPEETEDEADGEETPDDGAAADAGDGLLEEPLPEEEEETLAEEASLEGQPE